MSRITTLIFAKYPEPGRVNTRLVPPLTRDEAAALHQASLRCVIENVAVVAQLESILVGTPDERLDEFRGLTGDRVCDYWPQGKGDLGRRMNRAVNRAFEAGAKSVMLLGADSPTLPLSVLADAAEHLSHRDAVLGPCDDGGYYLLALSRPLPILFEKIDWGGDAVAEQTRRQATEAAIDLLELPPWHDLDRFDDLVRAARDLHHTTAPASPARASLRRLIQDYVRRYDDGRLRPT